ncbi:MAG: aspartate aminotransferase family protein [Bacteroidales bacterium]|jgi:acetylornithine/succinyldiaminopimelate/putrescine aminotransferase|nr:aspartate aminotransferase family protein [Bacteroidales bacterium]
MFTKTELFLKYLGQTSDSPYLVEVERAEGIYLFSPEGKKYFDLISGVSVSSLGHNSEIVNNAIIKQVNKHLHLMVYGEFVQSSQILLAEYLVNLLPKELNSVYFVNSGSEAVEGAIKLAKKFTGKYKMFAYKNAYHGSTAGALSLCGNDDFKKSAQPLLPNIHFLEPNNFEQLEKIDAETACVILEPIQAEAGIIIFEKFYLKSLRKKCTDLGCLLIFDEIQTGFGRTGKMFGFENFDVIPDIICFAKALGGGMPLGAFVAPKKIMDFFKFSPVLGHITTFGGHPVCCAAAHASLKFINENQLYKSIEQKSQLFKNLLKHDKIKEIRGIGLLLAIELESFDNILKLVKKGIELGFITDWFIFHDSAFRIAPPLTISEQEIIEACDLVLKALDSI